MRVSVVIPVRNGAEFIADAIESSLRQSLVPAEVIVVNDGSEDDSAGAADRAGAQVISQSGGGPGAARNHGARAATGELIAFLDADDVMTADRLALQSQWLVEHPGQLGVLGHLEPRQWGSGAWSPQSGPAVPGLLPSALTVRRVRFLATGGFDEQLSSGEFVDWLGQRRAEDGDLVVLEDVVGVRRIHDRNLTRDVAGLREGYLAVARKGIARSRPSTEGGHTPDQSP